MEPRFINRIAIGRQTLLEWNKAELYVRNGLFTFVSLASAVVYVFVGITLLVGAGVVQAAWMRLAAVAVFLLAGLTLLHWRVRPSLQVRRQMKQEPDSFSQENITLFYDVAALSMPNEEQAVQVITSLQGLAQNAQRLQEEYQNLTTDMQMASSAEDLLLLRKALEDLHGRMRRLADTVALLDDDAPCAYARLTEYLGTKNLHILYFGQQVLLVDKGGFMLGSDAAFAAFAKAQLEKALQAAEGEEPRALLQKSLQRLAKASPETPQKA